MMLGMRSEQKRGSCRKEIAPQLIGRVHFCQFPSQRTDRPEPKPKPPKPSLPCFTQSWKPRSRIASPLPRAKHEKDSHTQDLKHVRKQRAQWKRKRNNWEEQHTNKLIPPMRLQRILKPISLSSHQTPLSSHLSSPSLISSHLISSNPIPDYSNRTHIQPYISSSSCLPTFSALHTQSGTAANAVVLLGVSFFAVKKTGPG